MAEKEATLLVRIKEAGTAALKGITATLLNVKNAIDIGKAAWAAMKSVVNATLDAWGEQENAINSLNQSLVQQGVYSADLSKRYLDMATALQKTSTYGDEQITMAQATIQAFAGQNEITQELMQATLDFAAAKRIDLATAAELVGKSIGTETNALGRYGIEIEGASTKGEKMVVVQQKLNALVGGQAAVATNTTGAFQQFKNALGDIGEKIGGIIGPTIVTVTKYFTELLYKLVEFDTGFKILETGFQGVVGIASMVGSVFSAVGNQIGGVLAAIVQAMSGDFKQAWETAKQATVDSGKSIADSAVQTKDRLVGIWSEQNAAAEAARAKDEENMRASNMRKQQIETENAQLKLEQFNAQKATEIENELAVEQLNQDMRSGQKQLFTQTEIDNETNKQQKLKMMQQNQTAFDNEQRNQRFQAAVREGNLQKILQTEQVKTLQSTLGTISSLQNSHNKTMAAIGKAAAMANIIISTASGVMAAMSLGPILGPILAPIVIAAGVAQVAAVNGVQLANGGIVKAREGGVNATIGEGGRDEAVIPLDKGGGMMGNNITIYNYGGMLGDKEQAREFAIVIDQELLKLRQNNESQAFDTNIV